MERESLGQRLVRAGLATPEQLQGCSVADIEAIESALGVRLPTSYRDLLLAAGRNAGQFYATGNLAYPGLLGNRERANATLDDDRYPYRLPTNAVVFLASTAGDFSYFRADPAYADPPVFHYMGLDGDRKPIAKHFSAFIERAIVRYELPRGFMCCFCNQGIGTEGFDPCVLTLWSFVHGPPNERAAQDFLLPRHMPLRRDASVDSLLGPRCCPVRLSHQPPARRSSGRTETPCRGEAYYSLAKNSRRAGRRRSDRPSSSTA